jgi:hypothetical protein
MLLSCDNYEGARTIALFDELDKADCAKARLEKENEEYQEKMVESDYTYGGASPRHYPTDYFEIEEMEVNKI